LASKRAAPVQHRTGALQDLDALHVGRAAAHLARFAHAVAVDVTRIGLEAADVHALAAHVVIGVHTRHAVEHDRQVVDAVALVLVDLQRVDGLGDVLGRHVGLGGRGHALGTHVVGVVLVAGHLHGGQRLLRVLGILRQRPALQQRQASRRGARRGAALVAVGCFQGFMQCHGAASPLESG
jgi:hypothetical protein